jgi:hypothetical protein
MLIGLSEENALFFNIYISAGYTNSMFLNPFGHKSTVLPISSALWNFGNIQIMKDDHKTLWKWKFFIL